MAMAEKVPIQEVEGGQCVLNVSKLAQPCLEPLFRCPMKGSTRVPEEGLTPPFSTSFPLELYGALMWGYDPSKRCSRSRPCRTAKHSTNKTQESRMVTVEEGALHSHSLVTNQLCTAQKHL